MISIEKLDIPPGQLLHPDHHRYLTASRMAVAAGMSDWQTPLQLYLEMTGLRPRQGTTPLMFRGIAAEPMIDAYVRRDFPDVEITAPRAFFVAPAERIGATPDREMIDPATGDRINLEYKLVGKPAFDKWNGTLPTDYQVQLAATAMLGDFASSALAALVISNFDATLEMFYQPRHAAAEARILQLAAEWWQRIEARIPPMADYRRELELVKELNPPDPAVPVPLDLTGDNRIIELLNAREHWRAAHKTILDDLEAIDAEIVDKLKGATEATTRGWRITRKLYHRNEYTVAASDIARMTVKRIPE